jgi:deoxyribonuclease-4
MKFGLHVSIEGGVDKAPHRAYTEGCECFQIFSRSPHGGPSRPLDAAAVAAFKAEEQKYKAGNFYLHCPYYINFASESSRIRYGSISAVRTELEAADLLGARAVVTHLGSAKDLGKGAGPKLVEGLIKVFELPTGTKSAKTAKDKSGKVKYRKFKAKLLLEITAGTGNIMGDTFEEIASFILEAEKQLDKDTLGACFDTAHAFASGYDLRSGAAVHATFAAFDKIVGLDRIKLVHLNDSQAALDSHVDRHANLGRGEIGREGIECIVRELRSLKLDFVCETPPLHSAEDISFLKEMRSAL